jgi:hypothetical protein
VEVETSGIGFKGVILDGSHAEVEFTGTLMECQVGQSGTARELWGYKGVLEVLNESKEHQVSCSAITKGQLSALRNFRSSVPEMHQTIQHVFQLCTEFDFNVVARWVPRENLLVSDKLSQRPDAADWRLAESIVAQTLEWFEIKHVIDLFALDVHHVCDRFINQFYTPGCSGVQAFNLPWDQLVGPGEAAWIFPPARSAGLAISLIQRFIIDALLCVSIQKGSNAAIQLKLMQGVEVFQPFMVPNLFTLEKSWSAVHTSAILPNVYRKLPLMLQQCRSQCMGYFGIL